MFVLAQRTTLQGFIGVVPGTNYSVFRGTVFILLIITEFYKLEKYSLETAPNIIPTPQRGPVSTSVLKKKTKQVGPPNS